MAPKFGGRIKGTPNKLPGKVKQAIAKSLEIVSMDLNGKKPEDIPGVAYMKWLATEEPKAYATLLGKMVPQEIHAEIEAREYVVNLITGIPVGPPGSNLKLVEPEPEDAELLDS